VCRSVLELYALVTSDNEIVTVDAVIFAPSLVLGCFVRPDTGQTVKAGPPRTHFHIYDNTFTTQHFYDITLELRSSYKWTTPTNALVQNVGVSIRARSSYERHDRGVSYASRR
jgi:hypothetical protein